MKTFEDAWDDDSATSEDEDMEKCQSFGGTDKGDADEMVINKNTEYLLKRCSSLMQRVQGIMQATTAKHVSRQLQSVLEHPGLNPNMRSHPARGATSSTSFQEGPSSSSLTKQNISELQFTGKLLTNIIRHSMGRQLDPNDDSSTEESDTDDDEIVLPDERLMDHEHAPEYVPYLPVENNPFIEAIKMEKMYEARRTSIEYSINECEYSLTKSLHLRKHCKARKPLFQLEKPSASSNIINIPVDPTSSRAGLSSKESKETECSISANTSLDIFRVSDMMQKGPSGEQDRVKIAGSVDSRNSGSGALQSEATSSGKDTIVGDGSVAGSSQTTSDSSGSSQINSSQQKGTANEETAFMPAIKTLGCDGVSVLGVEFVNSPDPNQSSSRCSAVKRPDKNRKVFQLGGIQNIFRDSSRLPTVRCSCFGRNELCALCLGRAKRKAEINYEHMSNKDKLSILDETFHKSLSFSEDVSLEVLLTSNAMGNNFPPLIPTASGIQQLIKARSEQFPPDFLETGPKPKRPRIYDIKPYVEIPVRSPKKDSRYGDETSHAPRKRPPPRKSQSSFDERDLDDYPGKGLGWPARERKDSMRRTRNQEFDIDNIVIPYSMAASTRVEQLVYKPIETPRWRVLDYSEIFSLVSDDKVDGELEDMSNAAFLDRHNKSEIEEKKRFTQSVKKALNATRKTRRLDSTGRTDSMCEGLGANVTEETSETTPTPVQSPGQAKEMNSGVSTVEEKDNKGTSTPVTDNATVITEAMANQALKSLFKVGRRRTVSTSTKVEVQVEEEEAPVVVSKFVDPWPQRKFPLLENDYKEMMDVMQDTSSTDCSVTRSTHRAPLFDDLPTSPISP